MADFSSSIADALLLISKVSTNIQTNFENLQERVLASHQRLNSDSIEKEETNKTETNKTETNKENNDTKPVISTSTGLEPVNQDEKPKPDKTVEKSKPVIITDFGRKAEDDLRTSFKVPEKEKSEDIDFDKQPAFKNFISKLIGPGLLLIGGLGALVGVFNSDGTVRQVLSMLAKGGLMGAKGLFNTIVGKATGFLTKIGSFLLKPFAGLAKGGGKGFFGKMLGTFVKFLKPVLKRIPGIGSMISWATAYKDFKSGDLISGLMNVASGIAYLIPGIGTAVGIGIDILNAFLDTKEEDDSSKTGEGKGFSIRKFFVTIKDALLNNFPIKNLMQFGEGVGDVFSGNLKNGFKKMAFAIPFVKSISNFLFGEEEPAPMSEEQFQQTKGFFSKIKDSVVEKFKGWWKKAPKWVKWMANRVLPDKVLQALGSSGDDYDAVEEPVTIDDINQYREKTGKKPLSEEQVERIQQRQQLEKSREEIKAMSPEEYQAHKQSIEDFNLETDKKLIKKISEMESQGMSVDEIKENLELRDHDLRELNKLREDMERNEIEDGVVLRNGEATKINKHDELVGVRDGGVVDNIINSNNKKIEDILEKILERNVSLTQDQINLLQINNTLLQKFVEQKTIGNVINNTSVSNNTLNTSSLHRMRQGI